ncbi:DUF2231 domain-containing protein [Peterkaempfera griseoplana]|uniref:DUF2231 domain-containing protein n=1 Tax=Peterkaempfera griseoplana TaxID=66896 RepID=UPI0006E13163|nr:DUF2231 domain-containing protein [Peterkaempfera griseoplana]
MSFGLINDLPAHPLFVHATVTLVPLTALALAVCALWPGMARRLGWVLPALGLVTLVAVVLTTQSGEWLEEHVESSELLERHTAMGDDLTPWAIGMFVLTVVVWVLSHLAHRARRQGPGDVDTGGDRWARLASVPVRIAAVVLALAAAVGATVQVIRIGDSGATAVWTGEVSTQKHAK